MERLSTPAWPFGDSEMAQRIRTADWSDTPLGPMDRWPPTLRTAVDLMLATAQPVYIAWGPELASLYNDGYIPIAGTKHPDSLGLPYRAMWAEVWDIFRDATHRVMRGEPLFFTDLPLPLTGRQDRPMSWFTFSWTPIRTEAGAVGGFYCVATETTDRILAEQSSELHYQAVFSAMDEGYLLAEVIFDAADRAVDMAYLRANPAAIRMVGTDLTGRRLREISPDYEDYWFEIWGRVAKTGRSERLERYAKPEGRWYDFYVFKPDAEDAASRRVAVLFQDITARKRSEAALRESEERQAFLLRLSDTLRALADPVAIQRAAAQLLGTHLRASRVAYAEDTGDGASFDVSPNYVDGAPPLEGRFRYANWGADLLGELAAGRNRIQPDLTQDSRLTAAQRQQFADVGIGASMNVPLVKSGRLVALLGVNYAAPHVFEAGEIALVEAVAERTWAAVERARAETGLRESEGRLAAAFESVPVGIAAIDLSGAAVISNAEYRRFLPTGVISSLDIGSSTRWRAWDERGAALALPDFPSARALRGDSVVPGQEMLYTDDSGREIWTSVATAPTRDHAGRVTGIVAAIADIDAAKRSAEALRASEERFRQFGEASRDVLWIRDARTFQWEYLTPAFETIYGLDREAALRGDNMAGWLELIHPDDRAHAADELRRVRNGAWATFEYRIRRPVDGAVRWLRNTDFPIKDAAGEVVRIGGIGHDITDHKRTEDALASAETRQRVLMEGIPQLVWRSANGGLWTWASPQWLAFTGQTQDESHDWGWLDAVHPDDRAATVRDWEAAQAQGMLDTEYRIRRADDDRWVWHHTRSLPVRDAQGSILEWLGTSTDIQNLRQLQDQQHILVAELQHRTRNLMGVVRSMADKTARASTDLADFRLRFRDRLEALSRVQGLLSRLNEHDRVTFDELIDAELAAMDGAADRVSLDGPRGVRLRSSMVQTLAMALHELATNAMKYGALGQPQARLAITWSLEADGPGERPWLHIDWRESGVAMPEPGAEPTGGGQGRELIERALPYQLSASTRYDLGADGVHCTIAIPVSASRAAREEEATA